MYFFLYNQLFLFFFYLKNKTILAKLRMLYLSKTSWYAKNLKKRTETSVIEYIFLLGNNLKVGLLYRTYS